MTQRVLYTKVEYKTDYGKCGITDIVVKNKTDRMKLTKIRHKKREEKFIGVKRKINL